MHLETPTVRWRMDGLVDGMGGWLGGWLDGWLNGYIDVCMYVCMYACICQRRTRGALRVIVIDMPEHRGDFHF